MNMWERIKSAKWFIPVIVALVVGVITTGALMAAGVFATKTIPATGTIDITTTTVAPDFNYTLSPNINFGSTSFAVGDPVSVTGTVTVTNTGNQPINSLAIAGQNLPDWILNVTITQIPVPPGESVTETVTLSGTAPATPQTINLVGPNALSAGGISITPES